MENRVNRLKSLKLILNHARYQEKQISSTQNAQLFHTDPVEIILNHSNPSKTELGAYFVGLQYDGRSSNTIEITQNNQKPCHLSEKINSNHSGSSGAQQWPMGNHFTCLTPSKTESGAYFERLQSDGKKSKPSQIPENNSKPYQVSGKTNVIYWKILGSSEFLVEDGFQLLKSQTFTKFQHTLETISTNQRTT